MTITPNETDGDDGPVNNNGRRVLGDKVDSGVNVKNNNSATFFNRMNSRYARVPADKSAIHSVRRVLFGPPADPEETRIWLEQRIQAAIAQKSKAYNFDFFNEMPMEDRASDRYVWQIVKPAPQAPKVAEVDCSRTAGSTLPIDKRTQAKVTDYIKCIKRKMGDPASASLDEGQECSEHVIGADKRLRRFEPDEEEMQG